MTVHVEDPRAVNKVELYLGVLEVKFDEGSFESDNLGVREDYKLQENITNYFPPEEPKKDSLIPSLFTGFLLIQFLYFLKEVYVTNHSNFNNLSFWGAIFCLNYLSILGVIVAFWIKVNLVNTLWILLALAPVTLLTMNWGLTPKNCHVSQF